MSTTHAPEDVIRDTLWGLFGYADEWAGTHPDTEAAYADCGARIVGDLTAAGYRIVRDGERVHTTMTTDRETTMAVTAQSVLREPGRWGVRRIEAGAIVMVITAAGYRRAVIAPGLAEAGYGIVASSKPRCDGEMRDGDADV